MRSSPQTMIRTGLAVMLMVGIGVLQQYWGRSEPRPVTTSQAAEPAASAEKPVVEGAGNPTENLPVPVSTVSPKHVTETATSDFDFYVLALSWSPTYCSSDASSGPSNDFQCRSGRPFGFVLHGLWPQFERGYPENCASDEPGRVPVDIVRDALKLMPSERLVQHEWEKHGTCSKLTQDDYFATAALATEAVRVPKSFKQPPQLVQTTGNEVRQAFLNANPNMAPSGILVTCRRNEIAEVRVCLDKELQPRACSKDSLKSHCGARNARMLAVRGNWPRN